MPNHKKQKKRNGASNHLDAPFLPFADLLLARCQLYLGVRRIKLFAGHLS